MVGWFVVIFAVGALGMAQALPGTNTVTSDDIVNGQVKRPDIGRNAVTSAKIKNGNVKRADLGANAVNSAKVLDGSLTGADIADGTIANADIANGQINSQKITDNSLISADIANGQVLNADLGNNQINSQKVADNSLTGADIANNSSLGAAEINEGGLQFGCSQAGIANAWAYIDGNASFPGTSWTTSNIPARFNCSDSSSTAIQVRRVSTGVFEVRFRNLTGWIMTGTIDYNGSGACARSNLSVDYRGSSSGFGIWRVEIHEPTGLGTTLRNCEFSLVYF